MTTPIPAYEAVINIIYKRTPGFRLDIDYLLQTHIPMVAKEWAPHGLLGATVTEAPADSEYAYIVAVRFKTLEGWQKVSADPEQMGLLMADVPNFTNGTPDFVVGTVVKGGIIEAP
ncbi:uncharacterized protein N0V89_003548 [Didymosphaeria variabile]|uniref:EthD domain-containing protein n=1 Tax=Didymosphaeria variabile TaxID=1932322 RepID=A0A9W8XPH9_9PLEO|nr:uncharacterized protein N0V89_003548 [Didymosphaeria variabile]KAJ4355531.1 hypothetical protein N0V89_003548 [Didymosphaeria variabile]